MKKIYCNVIRFNAEVAEMIEKSLKNGETPYQMFLECNKLFAYASKGAYPEEDYYWIDRLCYENLVVLSSLFEPYAGECDESMQMLYQLTVCELTAKKAKDLTTEDFIKEYDDGKDIVITNTLKYETDF